MHETKFCGGCKSDLPSSAFAKNRAHHTGLQSQCRRCKKRTDALHYRENKDQQIQRNKINRASCLDEAAEYKASRGCRYCSENDPCCLDFHHTKDDKENTVSNLASGGCRQAMRKEMAKCDVVCANCHRKVHAGKL